MGTNYYWTRKYAADCSSWPGDDLRLAANPAYDVWLHIGKLHAAGPYCHECGTTLHVGGTRAVHTDSRYLPECPGCGTPTESLGHSASFTWTMMRHRRFLEHLAAVGDMGYAVTDEYGGPYTAAAFLRELESAKIQYQHCADFR